MLVPVPLLAVLLQVAPPAPSHEGGVRAASPWLLALIPFLVAGLWVLLRLSVRATIEAFKAKQGALEGRVDDAKRAQETLAADQKVLERRVSDSMTAALGGFAAELREDRERFERGLNERLGELKTAVDYLSGRLEEGWSERDRACEERHHRLGERHDSTRTEIDGLRDKVADLEGSTVPRSEWARDKVTLLAQGETIVGYLREIAGRKS